MANMFVAGGAVVGGMLVSAAGGIFYFQPHTVITKLIESFPR